MSDSEGKMRLGKKAPLLKALARSPPRIKFPAFQIFRPPPFPCLHEGANHGEKPTHNCPPQRRNHYLSSFTMRVWPTAFFGVQKSVHLAPRHFLRLTFFVVKIMGKGEYLCIKRFLCIFTLVEEQICKIMNIHRCCIVW